MHKPLRSRGFTLVELLVGAAVGAVVLVGISLTFISQAQQYQAHASRRALQANARQGLAYMGRQVRMAGYGVNPDRAILAYDSYNAVADNTLPGFPDAFVVHSRDPLFRRVVTTASPDTIVLAAPLSADRPLLRGQILLLVCGHEEGSTSENPQHAFVTVGVPAAGGTSTITLENIAPGSAPNSPTARPGRLFHEQALLTQPCFSDGTAQVVKVNRSAFYLDLFPDGDLMTPYLMLHQGLDVNNDGSINRADAVPVAEGIEQLQVAYILHTNDDDPPLIRGVTGAMPGTHYGELWEAIVLTPPAPIPPPEPGWFFNPNGKFTPEQMDGLRELDHPANIRQVRLTLVARSSLPEQGGYAGDDLLLRPDGTAYPDGENLPGVGFTWRHLENLDLPPAAGFTPQGGGFWRVIFRESITPKNLLLNRQFVPPSPQGGG